MSSTRRLALLKLLLSSVGNWLLQMSPSSSVSSSPAAAVLMTCASVIPVLGLATEFTVFADSTYSPQDKNVEIPVPQFDTVLEELRLVRFCSRCSTASTRN